MAAPRAGPVMDQRSWRKAVNLPADLHRALKIRAAQEGKPVRTLIAELLAAAIGFTLAREHPALVATRVEQSDHAEEEPGDRAAKEAFAEADALSAAEFAAAAEDADD